MVETSRRPIVVILGMHRSGTSMIAQAIRALGVDLGEDLIPGREENPDGFFEFAPIIRCTRAIDEALARRSMSPTGTLPYPEGWHLREDVAPYVAELTEILRQETASREGLWGFKDPGASRMLAMWKPIFEKVGLEPRYVIAVRHPAAVAGSLMKRNNVSRAHAELAWLVHNAATVADTAAQDRIFTDYERWLDAPVEEAARVAAFLGLPDPAGAEGVTEAILDSVKPTLRHHVADDGDASIREAGALHRLMAAAATGEPVDEAMALAARDFHDRLEPFTSWMADLDAAIDANARLREKNERLSKKNQRLRNKVDADGAQAKSDRGKSGLPVLEQLAPRPADPWSIHFPMFAELDLAVENPRRLRICIVTQDIVGPVKNGGIGTAYYYAAVSLAKAGHDVTILFALGTSSSDGPIEQWVDWYAERGVTFVPMPSPEVPLPGGIFGRSVRLAYGAYDWLKDREFDVIHVSEWRGIGYYAIQAKKLGIGFERTRIVVKTSSPTMWNKIGNAEAVDQLADLIVSHMERRSVELADLVVSGSQYMLRWMTSEGYHMPAGRCFNQPNIVPSDTFTMPAGEPRRIRVNDIVFFGRLEPRKGIFQFCDAITRLARLLKEQGRTDLPRVTFLGKAKRGFDAAALIAKRAQDWPFEVSIVDDRNQPQALEFLKEEGRLAVIPSTLDNSPFGIYECLIEDIAFVASDVGGIPELVAPRHRGQVLFDLHPHRIADKLLAVLTDGAIVPHPSFDFVQSERDWTQFHQAIAAGKLAGVTGERPVAEPAQPPVTVCITTHNRPDELRQAIDSVMAQDYPDLEAVVVDDGSSDPRMLEMLDAIEPEFAARGWKVIRQENLYPGAARNAGARVARGELVFFLDDDNLLKPNTIRRMVEIAQSNSIDYLSSFADVFEGREAPAEGEAPVRRIALLGDCLIVGLFYNGFGDANALVRKSAFDAVGGFTEDFGVGKEEQELAARLMLEGFRVVHVPEPLFWMRASPVRIRDKHYNWHAGDFRVMRPYLKAIPAALHPLIILAHGATRRLEQRKPAAESEGAGGVNDAATKESRLNAARLNEIARAAKVLKRTRRPQPPRRGFELTLPGALSKSGRLSLDVRVARTKNGRAQARGEPDALQLPAGSALRSVAELPKDGSIRGNLERLRGFHASGWLFDRARPGETLEVVIHVDGEEFARIPAKSRRPDLNEATGGHVFCGFRIELPNRIFDGSYHRIDAIEAGTGQALWNSPMVVGGAELDLNMIRMIEQALKGGAGKS